MAEYADCQPVARIGEACLRALVERAQLGDEAAFEAIYGDLAPRVLRFVRHYLGDPDLAEEVMQVTFMRVIEGLHRYQVRIGSRCRVGVPHRPERRRRCTA